MPFEFAQTKLADVALITPRVFPDDRGFFLEFYKKSDFHAAGITDEFVQDNHSKSTKNVLRGMHYQLPPYAQAKLVRVLQGKIYDVIIDLREDSPTFGQWDGHELSDENRRMLYVPTGFAHGFLVLSDTTEVEYKVSAEYSKDHERGILWNDPMIGIDWPVANPILSEKDRALPTFHDREKKTGRTTDQTDNTDNKTEISGTKKWEHEGRGNREQRTHI